MDTKKIIKLASKFGDKKGRHPYFHAKHYEGGYIVATDARTIAKCLFDYPDSQEGKTFDNASGREVKEKYPPYNGIFTPYRSEAGNELIPVTIDRKKADDGSEFVIMPVVNLHSDAVLCLNGEQDTELLKEKAAATMEQIPDKFSADAAKSDRMIQKLKKRLSIIQAAIDASTERDTETAGETCEVSTSATPTGQKTINTPTCPERAERLDEGDASICTNEPEEATGKPDGCPDAAERPDDTEILDGTTADDIDRRMLARIRENTEKRKKNPAQWMMERSHPMTIDEVAADGSADYCVYTRRDRGGRFSRATYAGIPGEDAAYITKKMIGECNDDTGHDFAISLRHRTKGIVYEWFWSAEKARRADIELEKAPVPPEPEETPPEAAKRKAGAPKRPIVTNIVPRLRDAIIRETGRQARALIKHLEACEIFDWPALMGKDGIYTLRDELRETCAPSSARTYMATMKGFLARHDEERGVCKDYRKILKNKADKAVKTWLNKRELEQVEAVEGLTPTESLVRARFLIGAYTGMRISDAMDVSESNVSGGMMTYVAKKTGTEATVPCPEKVMRLISYVQANDQYISLMTYNKLLKKICYKAKVFAKVKTHTAGETKEGPKWLFVSSHTARISFATNLANAGVPLVQLAGMMGHTSTTMTERYIVNKSVKLSERAMEYFA